MQITNAMPNNSIKTTRRDGFYELTIADLYFQATRVGSQWQLVQWYGPNAGWGEMTTHPTLRSCKEEVADWCGV